MRFLITGASGFIGRAFLGALNNHEVLGLCRTHLKPGLHRLDLLDRARVDACFDGFKPDVVIHCAARPNVDWCESNPAEARQSNVDLTRNILNAAGRLAARVVFLSTDYVFDGVNGPHFEDAPTKPLNAYGRFKLEAERAVTSSSQRHLVIRTTNVYGYDPDSKNFLMSILPQLARQEKVRVAHDQLGTPTDVVDLCELVRDLIVRGASGIIHVAGPDYLNRQEWASAAADVFSLDARLIERAATAELGQAAPRPLRAGLASRWLNSIVGRHAIGLKEGLDRMKTVKHSAAIQAW